MNSKMQPPKRHAKISFWPFVTPKVPVPERLATEYSPEEIAVCLEEFRLVAQRDKFFRGCRLACLVSMLISIWLMLTYSEWMVIPFGTLFSLGLILIYFSQHLHCSGCGIDVNECLGRFCPQCGSDGLQPARWLRAAHCDSCGRSMDYGKGGRCFKIRYCTHCGLPLDEKGV